MSARLYFTAAAPFEAARQVDILPAGHRARRLHGHSFLARVRAAFPPAVASFPGAESDVLAERLRAAVAPLDYSLLNEHLPTPTDENLARWLRTRLDLPGLASVGIHSTRDRGVDLDDRDHAHLWRRFRFEAAHQLPHVPPGHPCGRMHGHGFEVILHVDQDLGGRDLGVDYDRIDALWAPLHAELHHACLNELPGLDNPTSERLAGWLWERLRPQLPPLSWVTVYETATAGCHYDGRHYRIWKERTFDSALRLRRAPADDPRRRLHGHSYRIRLHLTAPLDEVRGWTVDYGEVKARFEPIYRALDHHRLDELPGLDDADPAGLLRWIKAALADCGLPLDRIDLEQTPGCGALLCWGEEGPALPV
ncbi:MAG: 6-carboxytetrahydropterin synthase [Candidatus Competibacter sp.]|jgi:6-pyruvoyltetrahydropterin/6-carboxytetrahydropterin synthase|nr:6-carboxytetrahydropterin synthase [Candidatus Competibacter sp.]